MSTEEKKNFQTFQDSNNVYKPLDEREASNFIKEVYSKNLPIEIIGTNSKNFIGNKHTKITPKTYSWHHHR